MERSSVPDDTTGAAGFGGGSDTSVTVMVTTAVSTPSSPCPSVTLSVKVYESFVSKSMGLLVLIWTLSPVALKSNLVLSPEWACEVL